MARRRTACHGFYHLVYFEFNIAGIGSDLAAAAGDRLGDLHRSRIGLGEKYLIGKQTACHIARTGPDEDLRCVCPVKPHIAGASFEGKRFCGSGILQKNIACGPAGDEVFAGNAGQICFSGGNAHRNIPCAAHI